MNRQPSILLIQMGGDVPLDPGPRFIDRSIASTFGPLSFAPSDFVGTVDLRHLFVGHEAVNFVLEDWTRLAHVIVGANDNYDGFVVWHGADTLAWAATAMSFLLQDLSKPVVFSTPNHSASADLVNASLHNAVRVAASPDDELRQVLVCFGSDVLQANRAVHVTGNGWHQFQSVRCPPIASIRDNAVAVANGMSNRLKQSQRKPSVNPMDWSKSLHLTLVPGNQAELYQPIIESRDIHNIILDVFPDVGPKQLKPWTDLVVAAKREDFLLVLSSRFPSTTPLSERFADTGFLVSENLTSHSLLAKLGILRSANLSRSEIETLLAYDFRGELDDPKGHVADLWTLRGPPAPAIDLAREVNSELLRYLSRHPESLYSLHPRGFEDLVATIFKHHGYDVSLTKETRDGGYDFRGILVDGLGIPFLTYVETKRYAEDSPVGVSVVRGVYGVVAAEGANRGVIVTTSRFTRDAKAFQATVANKISLYDFEDLRNWLQKLP